MFSGLQQLWDQTAPALLQQLPLQRHLGVLTHPLLRGNIQHRVQTCLRDQLLMEQEALLVLLEFGNKIHFISTKMRLGDILAPT